MSHPEQLAFIKLVAEKLPIDIKTGKIIEIGSYDVNGTTRNIFSKNEEYFGVDLTDGPGVDRVAFGHEIDQEDGYYDLAISAECFEHDPHWIKTFLNMIRLTHSGGYVVMTCASSGRPEHGTKRSNPKLSPGTQASGLDYYRNLTEKDFRQKIDIEKHFSNYKFWYVKNNFDLYFVGQRQTSSPNQEILSEIDDGISKVKQLMTLPHKLIRMPLRILKSFTNENLYQFFASRYWKHLDAFQSRLTKNKFSRS